MVRPSPSSKPGGSDPAPEPEETQSTQPLSFPPSHFAKISPTDFLRASLTSSSKSSAGAPSGVRPNGRLPTQCREASINAGSLANANGSAVVRLGATSVVCGVRAELLPTSNVHGGLPPDLESWQLSSGVDADGKPSRPSSEDNSAMRSDADILADMRLLVPNLELSTGCNPAHLPGNAPSAEAQSLTLRVLALLRSADLVSLAPLLVWHHPELTPDADIGISPDDEEMVTDENGDEYGKASAAEWQIKAIWTLYIDILYISLDGAAFDAAWLAVLAALRDTKLPAAHWDDDQEMLLCSPLRADAKPIHLRDLPVPLTAGLFTYKGGSEGTLLLYDTDDFEESVCHGAVSVVVTGGKGPKGRSSKSAKTKVLRIEASGKGAGMTPIMQVTKAAHARWEAWHKLLAWGS